MVGIKWNMHRFVYEDFFKYHGYEVEDNGQITRLAEGKGEEEKRTKEATVGKTTQANSGKWWDFTRRFS